MQFRTPQQEEVIQLAATKKTLLVTVLPVGCGKSIASIMQAILPSAGIIVVVAPLHRAAVSDRYSLRRFWAGPSAPARGTGLPTPGNIF
jgi:hypothetical protein